MPPSRPSKDRNSKEARVLANRYEVLKKLGSGNFGVAFLCNDIKNENEQKVLKEISVGDLQPDETVDAMHEARLLSRLDHPSIVKFHDSFIDGEFFCIITEYCDGGDLDDKITEYKKKGMKFEEKTVLDWIVQLTMALQYMHSRRVLHRDLKTRNIFLRQNMVKIGDFGISRILMGTTDMASTFTGTPYYMSPEVLKHEGYNSKSDVWSVGCILYELCALDHAFNGQGLMGVMYKIVEGEAPDIPKKYSRDLNDVMKKMLTKEPDLRPGAQEVLKLQYVLQHINKMKDTLTDEYRSRHHGNLNEEKAEKEAQEIAFLLREKSHLEDVRKTEVKEELKVKDTKYMSPRERMRLRKMQEADKRATELQKHAKVKLKENADRTKALKDTMSKTTVPAWKGGSGEGGTLTNALYVPDPRLTGSVSEEYATFGPHYRALSASHHGFYDDDDDNDVVTGTVLARTAGGRLGSFSALEDRPITPMRNTMVYNREHSTLDFKDGIPDSPELAETYYSQFEGEFEDSSPEKEKAGEIGEGEEKEEEEDEDEDEEGEGTIVAGGDDEMADYISRLEGALHTASSNEDTVISDDTISGAFGPGARDIKIKNLKKQCIASLGEEAFKKAYDYLRKARSDDKKSESDIMLGLREYVKNPSDCFIVDQLLFLEDVAKDS